jgi:hypothetical protein
MATITRTSFSKGDVPSTSEWNIQYDTIYNEFNGSISNVNIASAAAITATKLGNGDVDNTELSLLNGATTNLSVINNSSDWASYTPTIGGMGTVTNNTAYWARVGNTLYVNGGFTAGTPSASTITILIPNSLSASSNYTSLANTIVGDVIRDSSNGVTVFATVAASSTTVNMGSKNRTGDTNVATAANGSDIFGSSDDVIYNFCIML